MHHAQANARFKSKIENRTAVKFGEVAFSCLLEIVINSCLLGF